MADMLYKITNNSCCASSQDTCVALQALAAYSEATGGDQLNLRIEITTDRDFKKTLLINQKNALVQQYVDVSRAYIVGFIPNLTNSKDEETFPMLDGIFTAN